MSVMEEVFLMFIFLIIEKSAALIFLDLRL